MWKKHRFWKNIPVKQLIKRIEELEDSIALVEFECNDKGIDPKDDSNNHAEEKILALQARVEAKKSGKIIPFL